MATRKPSLGQRSLDLDSARTLIQQGYYSGDKPNPQLRSFVEENSRLYDPNCDTYSVSQHVPPISTDRSTPLFLMHSYWSKKPHEAIRRYVSHYTQPGDLILDPFCGTGGTAIVALSLNRSAIAIDLSPAATFITRGYCTPVDTPAVKQEFDRILASLRKKYGWLYETTAPDGRLARILSIHSSMRIKCPKCLTPVPLLSCTTRQSDGQRVCPVRGCNEPILSTGEKSGYADAFIEYAFKAGRRKAGIKPFPTEKDGFDQKLLARISDMPQPSLASDFRFPGRARIQSFPARGIYTLRDLYSPRNWLAMNYLRDEIMDVRDEQVRLALLFVFTSMCLKTSKCLGLNSDGVGRVQKHGLSPQLVALDVNVFDYFEVAWKSVSKGWAEVTSSVSSPNLLISTQDARNLGCIPPNSVDYVFTDPAYGDRVQFWESNLVWELWLGFDCRWADQEIVVNRVRGLTENDWRDGLAAAMKECFRVLKPGRWLTLAYNDDDVTWTLLQNLMLECGFVPDTSDQAIWMETRTKSEKQMRFGEDNTKRDLVINFRKPLPSEMPSVIANVVTGNESVSTLSERVGTIIRDFLTDHPGSSRSEVRDVVISHLVRKGALEPHDFEAFLRSVAETGAENEDAWYVKEDDQDLISPAESRIEGVAMTKVESFIAGVVESEPHSDGVPYFQLIEHYLFAISSKPRRKLTDLLPEYFVRTNSGNWRIPDAVEREELSVMRQTGTLRRIKRFSNALIDGVPVRDRDRPGSDTDLLDWLRQCRRAGLYEQGKAIYEKGGLNLANLSDEQQIEAEDDYRICVRRGSEAEDKPKRKSRKTHEDDEKTLF